MIKEEIKQMIEQDIKSCEKALEKKEGSQNLYLELNSKYAMIDKTFANNIKKSSKGGFGDTEFDYRVELRQIKSILETYIMLDEIPIVYNENIAEGVNIIIDAKNFKNNGNIGKSNSQDKNKQINENGKKKTNWFKNFTIFKKGKNK